MGAPVANNAFQYVQVLGTTVSTKAKSIIAQIGSVFGKGQTDSDTVKWMQHVGFASRPSNANIGKDAANALVVRVGGAELAIASQDERYLAIYGNLLPGESCMYSTGSDGNAQARVLLKADGSINCYTRKGNTSSGAGMLFSMNAATGQITLVNDLGYGLIIDSTGVKLTAGGSGSSLTLNASGTCSLVGTGQCQVDGSTVLLGSIAAPVVNAVCVGPAGLVAVASSKVLCALA